MNKERIQPLTAVLLALLFCQATHAQLFYSVNYATDELVEIDATTGNVSTVGGIGFDAINVDLAWLDGKLYGVDFDFGVRADLYEFDLMTGAATQLGQLFDDNGVIVLNAEGLAVRNDQLVVGFTTVPGGFGSTNFGVLQLDGSIESVVNVGVDIDGFANDSDGQLFGMDSDFGNNENRLFSVDPFELIGIQNMGANAIEDIAFLNETLFAITNTGLARIDQSTGALVSILILNPSSSNYSGLVAPNDGVLGDINCDGVVTLLDVSPFVALISGGGYSLKGDFNLDGEVNLIDVGPFVDSLVGF